MNGSVYPYELPDLIKRSEYCIADVMTLMKVYKLKLNDEKSGGYLSCKAITISRNIFHHLLYIDDISPEATDKDKYRRRHR